MVDERYPGLPDKFVTFRTLSQYDPKYFPKIIDVNPDWGAPEEKLGTMRYIVDYEWHCGFLGINDLFVDSIEYEDEYDKLSLPDNPTEDDIKSAGFMFLFSCEECGFLKKFYRKDKEPYHLLEIVDDGTYIYFSFTPDNPPLVDKSFPYYMEGTEYDRWFDKRFDKQYDLDWFLEPYIPTDTIKEIKKHVDDYIRKNISKFTPASYITVETEFATEEPDILFSVIDGPAPRCIDGTQFALKTYYIADYSYYMKQYILDYSKDKLQPELTYVHTFRVKK